MPWRQLRSDFWAPADNPDDSMVVEVRRRAGWVVLVVGASAAAVCGLLEASGHDALVPIGAPAFFLAVLALAGVAFALWRRVAGAERFLPWVAAATVGLGMGPAGVQSFPSDYVHVPALVAAAVAGPGRVVGVHAFSLLVLAARGGPDSPYLQGRFLAGTVVLGLFLLTASWATEAAVLRAGLMSRRIRAMLDGTQDLMLFHGPGSTLGELRGRGAERVLGTEVDAEGFFARMDPEDRALFAYQVERLRRRPGAVVQAMTRLRRDDGRWVHLHLRSVNLLDIPEVRAVVTTAVDVSDREAARAEMHERLEHMATHDALTGLPNRLLLRRRLSEILADPELWSGGAVVFVDLDNFKLVNDTLGHDVGDRLLQRCADRLRGVTGSGDLVCRFGGDEFVLVLRPRTSRRAVLAVVESVVATLRDTVDMDGNRVGTDASVGVSLLRREHTRPEDVIREADAAMYHAKARGRGRFAVFDEGMNLRVRRRHELGQGLRAAVERQDLQVEYQPKYDLHSGLLRGFEALVRWRTADGPVSPAEFIPIAEEVGLIGEIGEYVLETACWQFRTWTAGAPTDLRIAVNLSAHQIRTAADAARFVELIKETLEKTGIAAESLEIELTESALANHATHLLTMLHALRSMGVHVAIDDFGAGYSSLTYLRRVPADILKIDRAFVSGLGSDPVAAEIVAFVVGLGRARVGETVAEGVETPEQAEALQRLGVDVAQGYLYSRPVDGRAAGRLLGERRAAGLAS